jgi:hypothetical protein
MVPQRKVLVRCCGMLLAVSLFHMIAFSATGARDRSLYDFTGRPDGAASTSSPIADAQGHIYGTTSIGGTGTCVQGYNGPTVGCGTVWELIPPAQHGGAWTEKVLYSFQAGNDGAIPVAGLILDKNGNLYGTTSAGGTGLNCSFDGTSGCGTIFRLSAVQDGSWKETVLYSFQGAQDGGTPLGSLVSDGKGRLYGTTEVGGNGTCLAYTGACGTVFRLSPTPGNESWKKEILYSFNGSPDGALPAGGLVRDTKGSLYGTTSYGGGLRCDGDWNHAFCGGIVFQLSPPQTEGSAWTESVLITFYGLSSSATIPGASLAMDKDGNLYGTTVSGGSSMNCRDFEIYGSFGSCGTVFQLSPPSGSGAWSYSSIYSFNGTIDGAYPGYNGTSKLALDEKGNLYGTAPAAGNQANCVYMGKVAEPGCGTVWELSPPSTSGGVWTQTTLHAFAGANDGGTPFGGVYFRNGALFGTTSGQFGPAATDGSVYVLVP